MIKYMKKITLISAALISGTLALSSISAHANFPPSVNGQTMPSLAPMLEKITPAVVLISVKGTREVSQQVPDAFKFFFGKPNQNSTQERQFRGLGSGVIINAKEGYIVTNNHVIKEADNIIVTLKDGRQVEPIFFAST